jgi:hypothetical protein
MRIKSFSLFHAANSIIPLYSILYIGDALNYTSFIMTLKTPLKSKMFLREQEFY